MTASPKIVAVHMERALALGKGEPKESLVAERDGVTIELVGEWVMLTELQPTREGKPPRIAWIHGARVKWLEVAGVTGTVRATRTG